MYNTPIIIEKVYRAPFSKARENYVSGWEEILGTSLRDFLSK
jgi:hypothetical protein